MKVLIIQTAFLGDVILTLPLAQAIRKLFPGSIVDMMVVPAARDVVVGSPAVNTTVVYDKKGSQRGIVSLLTLGAGLRSEGYDAVVTPHRSLRTAILAFMTRAAVRVGFSNSALPWAFTRRMPFPSDVHEVDRNLSLLVGLDREPPLKERPKLEPTAEDVARVDEFLSAAGLNGRQFLSVAPGSVWYTKRWPTERYASFLQAVEASGRSCVIVGGPEDGPLANEILRRADAKSSVSSAGQFTVLQSAELIRRSEALVTNDSAPMHLAVAMSTRVVAIFGPTVPRFGFAPYGEGDVIVQDEHLECRPCTKHGGPECPIGTFECMLSISPERVVGEIERSDTEGRIH